MLETSSRVKLFAAANVETISLPDSVEDAAITNQMIQILQSIANEYADNGFGRYIEITEMTGIPQINLPPEVDTLAVATLSGQIHIYSIRFNPFLVLDLQSSDILKTLALTNNHFIKGD